MTKKTKYTAVYFITDEKYLFWNLLRDYLFYFKFPRKLWISCEIWNFIRSFSIIPREIGIFRIVRLKYRKNIRL